MWKLLNDLLHVDLHKEIRGYSEAEIALVSLQLALLKNTPRSLATHKCLAAVHNLVQIIESMPPHIALDWVHASHLTLEQMQGELDVYTKG